MLRSGRNRDRQKCIVPCRLVTGAVKRAKNEWLQDKARIVEVGMLSGHSKGNAWGNMREIRKRRAGLRPIRTRVIGRKVVTGVLAAAALTGFLNIGSSFSSDVINDVRNCPIDESLAAPPSEDEIIDDVCKMNGNKASGKMVCCLK